MGVDQSDKFTGNLARQNHTHHIHGLRRGDPQTSLEFRLNAQSLKHVRDLRASAMHHNRMQADLSQKNHIFSETGFEMIVDHRIAAIFDDDALSGEFLKPWQRLDQHFRLLVGAQIGMHVKMESRSFEFLGHYRSISFRNLH